MVACVQEVSTIESQRPILQFYPNPKLAASSKKMLGRILLLLLHVAVAASIGIVAGLSMKKSTIAVLFVLVTLAFLQSIYFDGCLMAKLEDKLPFTDIKPNTVLLSSFGVRDGAMRLEDLEKILIGMTAFFLLTKLWFLQFIETVTDKPYLQFMCSIQTIQPTSPWKRILKLLF